MISPYLVVLLVALAIFNVAYGVNVLRNAEAMAERHARSFVAGWGWPRKPVGARGHRIIGMLVIAIALLFLALLLGDIARRGVA